MMHGHMNIKFKVKLPVYTTKAHGGSTPWKYIRALQAKLHSMKVHKGFTGTAPLHEST